MTRNDIKHHTLNTKHVPSSLIPLLDAYYQRFTDNTTKQAISFNFPEAFYDNCAKVWLASDYVAQSCIDYPDIIADLFQSHDMLNSTCPTYYEKKLETLSSEINSEAELSHRLRLQRRREMVRIIWRDITHLATLSETLTDLSTMADNFILTALNSLNTKLTALYGTPVNPAQEPQEMLIIAVGKLGGYELNLSSDVDLIFSYPEQGSTINGNKTISCEQYFTKLAQQLVKVLSDMTVNGFVYRVDTRLRPYGNSGGQLVFSFNALESYYQEQGREWERYALVKARILNKPSKHTQHLMALLNAFVYRRYTDYSVIDALRTIKNTINQEINAKNLYEDIKKGPGGIREVEFIAQSFQLIRGGQDKNLQNPSLIATLEYLKFANELPAEIVEELLKSYRFLRLVENRIQAFQDQQIHCLPESEIDFLRILFGLEFTALDEYKKQQDTHRKCIKAHFDKMIYDSAEDSSPSLTIDSLSAVWLEQYDTNEAEALLHELGFSNANLVKRQLEALRNSKKTRALSGEGQNRLNKIMPILLLTILSKKNPDIALKRIIPLLESIMQRSTYFSLLLENPKSLEQLVSLCHSSTWIADYLSQNPILLDELVDNRILSYVYSPDKLTTQLNTLLEKHPYLDIEKILDLLRNFKHIHVFRVACANMTQKLNPKEICLNLAYIADCLLTYVKQLVLDENEEHDFAIIAYGKLGSYELGYNSDLDLVFLFDASTRNQENTTDVSHSYTKIIQRFINYITARTRCGKLYEIDTRLRPSGQAGLLISHFNAFEEYQTNKAWTWEHQALVKARVVSASPKLTEQFEHLRRKILTKKRDKQGLCKDILEMRNQLRSHFAPSSSTENLIKQGAGGLLDIEFIVQYLVLYWSHKHIELINFTDNVQLLKCLEDSCILSKSEASLLITCYDAYIETLLRLSLEHDMVVSNDIKELMNKATMIWNNYFAD